MQQGRLRKLADDIQGFYSAPDETVSLVILPGFEAIMCHTADGTCTTQLLAGGVYNVIFSPDSKYFVVQYDSRFVEESTPSELRRSDSGQVVSLADRARNVIFSPDSKYFVVWYDTKPGELRRSDGSQVVSLPPPCRDLSGYHPPNPRSHFQPRQQILRRAVRRHQDR